MIKRIKEECNYHKQSAGNRDRCECCKYFSKSIPLVVQGNTYRPKPLCVYDFLSYAVGKNPTASVVTKDGICDRFVHFSKHAKTKV